PPDDIAGGEVLTPARVLVRRFGLQPVLDEGHMVAPDLRLVGVGGGDLEEELEVLGQAESGSTFGNRQAQRAEPGFCPPPYLGVREGVRLLVLHGIRRDPRDDRREAGPQLVQGGHATTCSSFSRWACRDAATSPLSRTPARR